MSVQSALWIHAHLAAVVLFSGCGPIETLEGGTRAALPRKSERIYQVTRCTLTKGFREVKLKHPIWYHLGEDSAGPVVYERSHKGTVHVFQNRWTQGDGYHFLVLVINGPFAYEVVVPWDVKKPGVRRVWRRADVMPREGGWKPTPKAVPHAACPLTLEGDKSPPRGRVAPRRAPPKRRFTAPRQAEKHPPRRR